jgi:hypothetical protein
MQLFELAKYTPRCALLLAGNRQVLKRGDPRGFSVQKTFKQCRAVVKTKN